MLTSFHTASTRTVQKLLQAVLQFDGGLVSQHFSGQGYVGPAVTDVAFSRLLIGHLRRLSREGALPVESNGGSKSQLKVRRADLPSKQRRDGLKKQSQLDYDPEEDARDIAKAIGGAV